MAPLRWQIAWAALTGAFALHVLDEATHDFLSWYNPAALSLRERLGGVPFPPTFTFPVWITGLCVVIVALAALTRVIRSDRRWSVVLAYAYAAVHIANGLGHISVSIAGGFAAPGVLSSPVLLIAGAWLMVETTRATRASGQPTRSV